MHLFLLALLGPWLRYLMEVPLRPSVVATGILGELHPPQVTSRQTSTQDPLPAAGEQSGVGVSSAPAAPVAVAAIPSTRPSRGTRPRVSARADPASAGPAAADDASEQGTAALSAAPLAPGAATSPSDSPPLGPAAVAAAGGASPDSGSLDELLPSVPLLETVPPASQLPLNPPEVAESDRCGRAAAELRAAVEARKRYPALARRRGLSGTVVVAFRTGADGALADLAVQRSSGSALLDEAALAAVRDAAPFPVGGCSFSLPIRFRLAGGDSDP